MVHLVAAEPDLALALDPRVRFKLHPLFCHPDAHSGVQSGPSDKDVQSECLRETRRSRHERAHSAHGPTELSDRKPVRISWQSASQRSNATSKKPKWHSPQGKAHRADQQRSLKQDGKR